MAEGLASVARETQKENAESLPLRLMLNPDPFFSVLFTYSPFLTITISKASVIARKFTTAANHRNFRNFQG